MKALKAVEEKFIRKRKRLQLSEVFLLKAVEMLVEKLKSVMFLDVFDLSMCLKKCLTKKM